jgi:PleD family two-component response regulator
MSTDPTTPDTILIADSRRETLGRLEACLQHAGFDLTLVETAEAAQQAFYAARPKCLVLNHDMRGASGVSLLREIKSDNVYGHLPCIAIVTQEALQAVDDWSVMPADDYLLEPLNDIEIVSRTKLCLARAQRDVNANPLTGLPGNLTITREAERRLSQGEPFGFAYLDVDNFKAYNDKYGFSRGDEVLRMTSRVTVNALRHLDDPDYYVGHIGGDDFVFVTPCALLPVACAEITANFDLIVPDFYDDDDRERGSIQSVDRQGAPHRYPLMSVSIGAVDTSVTAIRHMAEMFSRVTEVKSFTKRLPGSNFIIDRRTA